MRRTLARGAVLAALLAATTALAQPQLGPPMPAPRITSVYPMGAKAGTTAEVTVFGTDIDEPTGLMFSHPGLTGEVLSAPETAPDPKNKGGMKAKAKTGPATQAKFKVTVSPGVPLGTHDVRIVSKLGISNPRAFVVGDRPEVVEQEKPHNDVPLAQKVELGTVVNGVLATATEVDYYAVAAKANTRVLAYCATSSIDSKARPQLEVFDAAGKRLGSNRNFRDNDALLDFTPPADGEYLIRVAEFAYQTGGPDYFYRLSIGTAPFIDAVYPPAVKPGTSTQVTLYGRNLPGGKPTPGPSPDGKPLEALTVTITAPADAAGKLDVRGYVPPTMALQDGFEYALKGSNAVPVYLTDLPVAMEADADNDKPETAQPVSLPCEIVGRIEKRYDKDWFAFAAKKGEVLQFDLHADRVGSGMDTYFVVKNLANMGNVVEEQDDDPDPLHPTAFFTRSGDPASAKFTAPADGKYAVMVGSRESNITFGPRSIYRLRIAKPAPDFRAVAMPKCRDLPACTVADQGGDVGIDVFIDRRDGFTGPVTATVEGLPKGAAAKPATIGTAARWGTVVVSTKTDAAAFTGSITVKCAAQIDGKPVVRSARPATITWAGPQGQANVPQIARLDRSLPFAVRLEKAPFRIAADSAGIKVKTKDKDGKETETAGTQPLYVKPGDKLTVPVKVTWQGEGERPNPVNVHLEPYQPGMQNAPVGLGQGGGGNNAPAATVLKEKGETTLALDVRSTAAPGTYSLALRADTQIPFARDPSMKDKKTPFTAAAYAEPFEVIVLPTSLAKLLATAPATMKPGATAEIVVKADRLADYAGEFKIAVVLPKDAKGVTIADAVLPAGKDEIKLTVKVADDAKPAQIPNVVVSATGTVFGQFPIRSEVKVNLVVGK